MASTTVISEAVVEHVHRYYMTSGFQVKHNPSHQWNTFTTDCHIYNIWKPYWSCTLFLNCYTLPNKLVIIIREWFNLPWLQTNWRNSATWPLLMLVLWIVTAQSLCDFATSTHLRSKAHFETLEHRMWLDWACPSMTACGYHCDSWKASGELLIRVKEIFQQFYFYWS